MVDAQIVLEAAQAEGFELAGVTPALPHADQGRYLDWVGRGQAAGMEYLKDHRAGVRSDPRLIFAAAETMLCVGKLYQTEGPSGVAECGEGEGWISRYAWGARDYHDVLGEGLHRVAKRLQERVGEFAYRVCVDSAPLLERSYAREAGLGWIGKNTCLIHEGKGSWFFLGELLLPFAVTGYGVPPPDRCGTCTRCIEACPTAAIVEGPQGWEVASDRCISYWTIEAKAEAPEELRRAFGKHLFGCDICQDVCPWNRKAPLTEEAGFQPVHACVELRELEDAEFRERYRKTPVARTKVSGFNRNVRVVLENGGEEG
jgi:epoxyqueuosine reductase